jgi:hypothetical protein
MTPGLNRKYSITMERLASAKRSSLLVHGARGKKVLYRPHIFFFFSLQSLFVKPKPLDFANMFSAI